MRVPLLGLGSIVVLVVVASPALGSGGSSVTPLSSNGTGTSVELITGTAGIAFTPTGELAIDGADDGVGLNPNARYVFGDPSDPTTDMAFGIRHNVSTRRGLTVGYTDDAGAALGHVQLEIYDADGDEVGRIDGDSPSVTFAADPSEPMHYVVLIVDTHGVAAGERLSGTLTVTV